MNRTVLIVTPFFAPQVHAAVFRAYKLAKYLPRFGWTPFVLTAATQYQYNEDPSLLNSLPAEVQIVTSRYIEPSLRGIRMALGGKDRTFRTLKPAMLAARPDGSSGPHMDSILRRLYLRMLARWFSTPDTYWTWSRTAIPVARALIRKHRIPVVYTTAPPYSSLVIGRELQRAGIRWVADFRDPLCYTRKLTSEVPSICKRQRRIVHDALAHADAVTFAASSFRKIYLEMFGELGVPPVFIPTGIDEEVACCAPSENAPTHPYLVFAGEILPDYDATFWETFADVLQNEAVARTGVRVLVIGDLLLNRRRLQPVLSRLRLESRVEFRDQMPQQEVYGILRNALAGLLIPGTQAYWWTAFAKMIDCIGMHKPMVTVVPDPSEARSALLRTGLGVFLDGSTAERAAALTAFLITGSSNCSPVESECRRYTAMQQVQDFVSLFETLPAR